MTPPVQFIFFFSFIRLSQTALRAAVTMLAPEEKPCYLQSGCSIYICACADQTHHLWPSTTPIKPGDGYADRPGWALLPGSWLSSSGSLLPSYLVIGHQHSWMIINTLWVNVNAELYQDLPRVKTHMAVCVGKAKQMVTSCTEHVW